MTNMINNVMNYSFYPYYPDNTILSVAYSKSQFLQLLKFVDKDTISVNNVSQRFATMLVM